MIMELWIAIGGMVGALLGGGVLGSIITAYLKYKGESEARKTAAVAAKEKTIADITERVRAEASERQKVADAHLELYRKALEARVTTLETQNQTLQKELDVLERRCEECDIARQYQQREINELRMLVMKSEGGAGTAIITSDEEGTILEWNEMATLMFKYTRSEALGRNVSMLVPSHTQPYHHAALAEAFKTGKVKDAGFRDLTAVDAMGNERPVKVRLTINFYNGNKRATAEIKDRKSAEQIESAIGHPPVTTL